MRGGNASVGHAPLISSSHPLFAPRSLSPRQKELMEEFRAEQDRLRGDSRGNPRDSFVREAINRVTSFLKGRNS